MSQREHEQPQPIAQPIPPQPEQPEPDDDEDNGDDGDNGKEKENACGVRKVRNAAVPFPKRKNSFAKEMPNSLAWNAIARVRQSKTLQEIFSACEVRSSMLAASPTRRSPGSWLHRSDNQLPNSFTYG